MKLFRMDNTEGYTQDQLDAFNKEWADKVELLNLEEGTDEYDWRSKAFCNEVASR